MTDTMRQHRVGVVAWVLGGAVAMFFMGLSLAQEMRDFPGAPRHSRRW